MFRGGLVCMGQVLQVAINITFAVMHARNTFSNADTQTSCDRITPLGSETEQQHADGSVKLRMCGLIGRKPVANERVQMCASSCALDRRHYDKIHGAAERRSHERGQNALNIGLLGYMAGRC
jgi:hypothetical protein